MSNAVLTRAFMGSILMIVPVGLSACASATETPTNAVDAVLLNPQDGATRQAIHVFVREKSGVGLIANPDSLATSPALSNTQRTLDRGLNKRAVFKPYGDYRLIMDENNRCWLTHRLQDVVSQVELPSSASCAAYRTS